jgi:hypothetical protein
VRRSQEGRLYKLSGRGRVKPALARLVRQLLMIQWREGGFVENPDGWRSEQISLNFKHWILRSMISI